MTTDTKQRIIAASLIMALGTLAVWLICMFYANIASHERDNLSELRDRCDEWGGEFMISYVDPAYNDPSGFRVYCWKDNVETLFDFTE